MFSTILEKRNSTGTLAAYDDFWYSISGVPTSSGKKVNQNTAMRLWAVYACVSLISETLAGLPLKLKRRRKDGGTEDATDNNLYYLLKLAPNPDMTSFTWRETCQGNLLCSGNTYSYLERGGSKDIKAIWPIEPLKVEPKKIKKRLFYVVDNGDGTKRTVVARDMLHVVGFGFNGLIGESVITNFAKETIGNGLALDEFQGSFFKNGVHTSGTLEHPNTLGDNKDTFLEALRKRYQGGKNVGVPMVLEAGMKFNQNKVSMVDQQFLEQMESTALQICGIFKVPPSKVGIYGKGTSYNNTEQQGKNFLDTTMLQWLVRWEQAMNIKLLNDDERRSGLFIKYNFDALLRPDAKTRAEIGQKEWQQGVPLNVIRARNDENPLPGGDVGFVPMNFIPVEKAIKAPVAQPTEKKAGEKIKFFSGKEIDETIHGAERRSEIDAVGRDHADSVNAAFAGLVKSETKNLRKVLPQTALSADEVRDIIDEFYKAMPATVKKKIQSALFRYQDDVSFEAQQMIGKGDGGAKLRRELAKFKAGYIDSLSERYTGDSKKQIATILNRATANDLIAELKDKLDVWDADKAQRYADEELIRAGNAIARENWSLSGVTKLVWVAQGSKSCPFCQELNGKVVGIDKPFMDDGEVLYASDGKNWMAMNGKKMHPPIHRGCVCAIMPMQG